MSDDGAWADVYAARYWATDLGTPAAQVPASADGVFYLQRGKVVEWMVAKLWDSMASLDFTAESGHDLRQGARENLTAILHNGIANFSFGTLQSAGGWKATLEWMLTRPIFTWDKDAPLVRDRVTFMGEFPLPFQQRAPDAWSASPGIAMMLLGWSIDGGGNINPVNLPGRITQAYYHPTYGVVFNDAFVNTFRASLVGMVDRQVQGVAWREDKIWNLLPEYRWAEVMDPAWQQDLRVAAGGFGAGILLCPSPSEAGGRECTSHQLFQRIMRVEPWRCFPWVSCAFQLPRMIYEPLNQAAGLARDARRQQDVIEVVQGLGYVMAVAGVGMALGAIITNGLTIGNALNLVVKADQLPGVDFGNAGKILSLANGRLDLSMFERSAGIALDLSDVATTLPIEDVPMDFDLSQGVGFGFDVPADQWNWNFDLPSLDMDLGFGDWGAAGGWGYGDVSVPADDWLSWDFGQFAFDVPDVAAGGGMDEVPIAQTFDSNVQGLVEQSTNWGDVAGAAAKFLTGMGQLYLQYNQQQLAAEQMGRQLSPTVARPTPGSTYRLPDGSTAVVNADGSTTVRTPQGQVRTVTPQGTLINGAPSSVLGGQLIPGVSNVVLLGGAALAVGALLLARK